ncbi:MAG: hypothetical protein WBA12_04730 [Catalinimonas sp.]
MPATQTIPAALIYETHDGQPIYYRGYRECLENTKPPQEVTSSNYLQSELIAQIVHALMLVEVVVGTTINVAALTTD